MGENSRSTQAARWLAEHGGAMRDVATQFGITHQAVSQAWSRLYGNRPPIAFQRLLARARILDLARSGKTSEQIVEATGVSRITVRRYCHQENVVLVSAAEARRALYDGACAAVAAGACVVDAAIDHNVSRGTLNRELSRRGIAAARGPRGRMDGRTARAVARVRDLRESVVAACKAERVATGHVYRALKQGAR